MTGYGSGSAKVPGGRVSVEIKSVNHRFLDAGMKGPREYLGLERGLVGRVREALRRGKVDIFVNKMPDPGDPHAVQVDLDLGRSYHKAIGLLADALELGAGVPLSLVAGQRGVLLVGGLTPDVEKDAQGVEAAMNEALEALIAMREAEGKRLQQNLLDNRKRLGELLRDLEARAPQVVESYRKDLAERLETLLQEQTLDEARLTQEVAILAERTDIHEELVRLSSHLEQLEAFVSGGGEVGRKLDFLLQEINREVNTAGSKVGDAQASRIVVEMKGVAERVREQIQNVE
jgi:uncharacterized protein (TIGR00255 family)